MSSHQRPPWVTDSGSRSKRPPPSSTVPAKRTGDSRSDDRGSKRAHISTTAQEEAWVAEEDRFVLQQSKKRAALRVKGGRAKPIDWLAVILRFIDPTKTTLDEEIEDEELDVVDPEGVFEGLSDRELSELQEDIENFLTLETDSGNKDYWNALRIICKDLRRRFKASKAASATDTVAEDINRILAPKTHEQLVTLEGQVKNKLNSDEPIDFDYWEELLRTLRVFKAKAKLRRVSKDIISERLEGLRKQQEEAALVIQKQIQEQLAGKVVSNEGGVPYDSALDPEPSLKLRAEDKALASSEEKKFLESVISERRKVVKSGYMPLQKPVHDLGSKGGISKMDRSNTSASLRFAPMEDEDPSQASKELFEREVARGVEEGEEIFTGEEKIVSENSGGNGTDRTRKPRYFNRVLMGYEWNKYNQTHYDHDNPPPKVVQGYRFNIFYPDLANKAKAPTFKIERENGRKRGQSFAPAGEDDTCLLRFVAGAPYEDIAFRVVDKEWDYSAKRERGFKSTFDKGILQVHFQFKKVYYRK